MANVGYIIGNDLEAYAAKVRAEEQERIAVYLRSRILELRKIQGYLDSIAEPKLAASNGFAARELEKVLGV